MTGAFVDARISGWDSLVEVATFDHLIATDDRNAGNILLDGHVQFSASAAHAIAANPCDELGIGTDSVGL